MSKTAPVSVIVPTLGTRGGLLSRAITSALASGAAEVIVVDDGTPDDSVLQACAELGIVPIRTAENFGISSARNRGVSAAGQPFVYFLDSDDVLEVEEWPALDAQDQESVIAAEYQLSEDGVRSRERASSATMAEFKRHAFGVQVSYYVFPVSIVRSIRFDESLRSWEDWDLLFRLRAAGVPFRSHPGVLSRMTADATDRVTSSINMVTSLVLLFDKVEWSLNRSERALWQFKIGNVSRRVGAPSGRHFFRSLWLDPLHPKRVLRAIGLR